MDDDELAYALSLKQRQQANSRCRALEQAGVVARRKQNGKIRNFLLSSPVVETAPAATVIVPTADRDWFWEGHVQSRVVDYLVARGCTLIRQANTAQRETGKDIEAQIGNIPLWVTVKGWPKGTLKTQPSTQAGHWFKDALFDIVA